MMKFRPLLTAVFAGLLMTSIGNAQDDTAALVEASKAENGLLLYSSSEVETWDAAVAAFSELYPWITVEIVPLGSNEVWERFQAEKATSVRTADIIVSGSPTRFVEAADRGDLVDYTPPGVENLRTIPDAPAGVIPVMVDPQVLIWNKVTLPEALWPTSFVDLADKAAQDPAAFAGKVATFDLRSSSVGPGYVVAMSDKLGDVYWDALAKLGPALRFESGGSAMLEKVTSGEYVAAFHVTGRVAKLQITGPRAELVGWTYYPASPLHVRSMAIPTITPNINSAKLFANYLVTKEGQEAFAQGGSIPLHNDITDSETVTTLRTLESQYGEFSVFAYQRSLLSFEQDVVPKIDAAIGAQ